MSKLSQNVLLGFFCLVFVVLGMIVYISLAAPRMSRESRLVLNDFYAHSQAGRYAQAHQLLSDNLQDDVSLQALTRQWAAFEQAHGKISNWVPARGGTTSGDKVSVFPRYTEFSHKVTGRKGGAGTVFVRMVPQDNSWRIARLTIRP